MFLTVVDFEEGILPGKPLITFWENIDLPSFDLFVSNLEFG